MKENKKGTKRTIFHREAECGIGMELREQYVLLYPANTPLFLECTSSPRALCSGERISFTNFKPFEEGIEYFEQIIIGKVAWK